MVCDSINVLRQLNNCGRGNKQEYHDKLKEDKEKGIREICNLIKKTQECENNEDDIQRVKKEIIQKLGLNQSKIEDDPDVIMNKMEIVDLEKLLKYQIDILKYMMKKHKNSRAKIFYSNVFCHTFNKFRCKLEKEKQELLTYKDEEQNKINKNNDERVREYVFSHTYLPEISEKLQKIQQKCIISNSEDWKQMILSKQNKQKAKTGDKESNQVITIPNCLKPIYQTVRTMTEKKFCESLPKDSNEFKTKLQDYKKSLDGITLEGDNTRRGKYIQRTQNCSECFLYLIENHKHSKFQNMADLFVDEINDLMNELGYHNKNNQKSTYNKNNEEEKVNGLS